MLSKKRFLTASFLFVLFAALMFTSTVKADSSNAAALSLNTETSGTVTKDAKTNWYKFTITEDGYSNISFTNLSSNTNWNLELYNSSMKSLCKFSNISDSLQTYKLPLQPGEYYAEVTALYVPQDNQNFKIKIDFTASSEFEKETNDTYQTANTLPLDTAIIGNLMSSADEDYYSFEVTEPGYFNLDFSVKTETIPYGWTAEIMDSSLNLIYSEHIKSSSASPDYAFAKGTYYVKIRPNFPSNAPIGKDYTLTVHFNKDSFWEEENNDSMKDSNDIKFNSIYTGTLYNFDDLDYYSFTVSKTQTAKLSMDFIAENVGWGWNVTILDSKGNSLLSSKFKAAGESKAVVLKKGTYFVKIAADFTMSAPTNIPYHFQLRSYETEKNNTAAKANQILMLKSSSTKSTGTIYGNLSAKSDVDFYKLTVSKNSAATISLTGTAKAYKVTVYYNGKAVSSFNQSKSTTKTTLSLKKGTYTIAVQNYGSKYSAKTYHLDTALTAK